MPPRGHLRGRAASAARATTQVRERLAETAHVRTIEGNSRSPDEFEMFERKGWPPEERRACIAFRMEGATDWRETPKRLALASTTEHEACPAS